MAIYHLTATVISRARGQSVVAAAAYRFGAALKDERYGTTHRHSRGPTIAHAEIMTPGEPPPWVHDREQLWNRVEASERRKDAQLARVVEVGLPVELSFEENLALVRDFVASEFVSEGMIADFCIRAHATNPHAQILLTLRPLTEGGFGLKERRWNGRAVLQRWRAAWADRANAHLARAGHHARIDHRTLEAQNIELTPGRRLGVPRERQAEGDLPEHLRDRFAEQARVAQANGEAIVEDPTLVLRSLTQQQASFECPELVMLDEARFTSTEMVEAEKALLRRAAAMAGRRGHGLGEAAEPPSQVLAYLLGEGDAKAVVLASGGEKERVMKHAVDAWLRSSFPVLALARSARAAEALQLACETPWQTIAAREATWVRGAETLRKETVVLIDGAEMLGLRQLERWVGIADKARGKVVLVGDRAQLEAMKTESAFAQVLRLIGPPR